MLPEIDVLLATCNGEAYLEQFLESLLVQTYDNFRVIVRDDKSDDATLTILEKYQSKFNGRLLIVDDELGRLGVVLNFEQLLKWSVTHSSAHWFAFADQDDVWLPDKLKIFAKETCEFKSDSFLPCLIFSDLIVVDRNLEPFAPSFWQYEGIKPNYDIKLPLLLGRNVVTGCAAMVNRHLVDMALPFPRSVLMHDWWCALIAAHGSIRAINTPLVLYRQHGANTLGARRGGVLGMALRFMVSAPLVLQRVRTLGVGTYIQTKALRDRMIQWKQVTDVVDLYLTFRCSNVWVRMMHFTFFSRWTRSDDWVKILLWTKIH